MMFIDRLAEQRIQSAMRNGELDSLEGTGKPLYLDDDSLLPDVNRMALRVLKNAGCLPRELQLRHQIRALENQLGRAQSDRSSIRRQLDRLRLQLMLSGHQGSLITQQAQYRAKLAAPQAQRLSHHRTSGTNDACLSAMIAGR